jgi:hypothetical protein
MSPDRVHGLVDEPDRERTRFMGALTAIARDAAARPVVPDHYPQQALQLESATA